MRTLRMMERSWLRFDRVGSMHERSLFDGYAKNDLHFVPSLILVVGDRRQGEP